MSQFFSYVHKHNFSKIIHLKIIVATLKCSLEPLLVDGFASQSNETDKILILSVFC